MIAVIARDYHTVDMTLDERARRLEARATRIEAEYLDAMVRF
jgi:hypothetical protein